MNGGFTKGLMVGSIIGASVIMMNPDMLKGRNKKRMMRNGRYFLRRSSNIIGDVIDIFR